MPPDSLATVLPELRKPFSPAAVRFKVQVNPKQREQGFSSALIVTYMDSRLAAERLNAVCPGEWGDEYVDRTQKGVVCRLTVFGQTRSDVGFSDDPSTDMGLKGLYSDAFKRAAVKFGIGACFYALPQLFVKAERLKHAGGKWYMTSQAEADLRGMYERWLRGPGKERFGDPLDHGDVLEVGS